MFTMMVEVKQKKSEWFVVQTNYRNVDTMFFEVVDLHEKVKMTKPFDRQNLMRKPPDLQASANTDRSPHAYKAAYALLP